MAGEAWWERADRLRRVRRVPLKAVAEATGKTVSWASYALGGRWPTLGREDLEGIALALGISYDELTGRVPVGAANVSRVGAVRPGSGLRLPIINTVDAGPGPGHDRQVEEWFEVSESLLGGLDHGVGYVVSGDCLRDVLIAAGDYLIIDPENKEPQQGEIVVARVNGVEVAKLFYRHGETVELRPASLGFETIVVRPEDEFEVVGTYVASVRPAKRRK